MEKNISGNYLYPKSSLLCFSRDFALNNKTEYTKE